MESSIGIIPPFRDSATVAHCVAAIDLYFFRPPDRKGENKTETYPVPRSASSRIRNLKAISIRVLSAPRGNDQTIVNTLHDVLD